MTRSHILISLGVLTGLAPFFGLPISWLEFILPALGIIIAAIGYSLRVPRRTRAKHDAPAIAPAS